MTRTEMAHRLQCIRDEWVAAEWEDYRLWEALSTLIADLERPPDLPETVRDAEILRLIDVGLYPHWDLAACECETCEALRQIRTLVRARQVALDLAESNAAEEPKGENPHV